MVADFGRCLVAVKAVSVFHDEFAAAHQTKARATLVAKFGLDLVQVLGQLFVAFDVLAHHIRHDFFAGRLNDEIAAVAVFDAQQLGPVGGETPGFLPQFRWLNDRHCHFNSASAVHLFPHNRFNLANHTQPHGHIAVNASAQFFDQTCARHELMAGDFSVAGRFFQGGDEELGGFHGLL